MPFPFSAIANITGSTVDNRGTAATDLSGYYDTDDEIRIVTKNGTTAICYRTTTRIEVYVFDDPAIPPINITPAFVIDNSVATNKIIDLLPFSDGTFGFLYWQHSGVFPIAAGQEIGPILYVHFDKFGKDAETGSPTLQHRAFFEEGVFRHTASASVNAQDEILVACAQYTSVTNVEYMLRIVKFTKNAVPITNPGSYIMLESSSIQSGLTVFSNASGSSYKSFMRRQPASNKTLLIVGRNRVSGPFFAPMERAIDVWTINNQTMEWWGPKNVTTQAGADELFSIATGSFNRIYECFDDESGNFGDAVWFSHDGPVSQAHRTLYLISPLIPSGVASGQPGDVFVQLKKFEGIVDQYTLPLRQAAFDDAGRIYTGNMGGPNVVNIFDTTQETVTHTEELVTPPNPAHRVCRIGRGLVQVGVDSFRGLSTGGGTDFLKSTPTAIESGPPPPPESTTGLTHRASPLTTLSIPKGDILGIAVNSASTVAVLYKSGGILNVICRFSDGSLSAVTQLASGTTVSTTGVTTPIQDLGTDFVVNYMLDGNLYYRRFFPPITGPFLVTAATIILAAPGVNIVRNRHSTILFDDGSFCLTYDERNTVALTKKIECIKFSSAAVNLGNYGPLSVSPVFSDTDADSNIEAFTRPRQSSGDFLIGLTYNDPVATTVRTRLFTADSASLALDPTLPFDLPTGDGAYGDFRGIRDARSADGLWFNRKNGTSETYMFTPEVSANPSQDRGPYAATLLSTNVVYDSPDGNWYSTDATYKIFQQSYLTGAVTESTVEYQSIDQSTGNELLPFVAGTGFLFYGISGNTTNSTIVKFERTDVSPSDNTGTISRIIGVCSIPSLTFSGKKFELHSLAENNLKEMAVLRHERDTDTLFPAGALYIDLFDDTCNYLGPSVVAPATSPAIISGYGTVGSNENSTPHVISFASGDYLVYWGEKQSSGSGLFKASRRNRDAAHPTVALGGPIWPSPKESIAITPSTAWSAQVTILKDDSFFVSWIDWTFGAATAELKIRRFSSFGDPMGPAITLDSFYGNMFFRKRVIAPEYAGSQLILVYTTNDQTAGKKIRMMIAETPPKALVPSLFDFPRAAEIEGDVVISGFGDNVLGQLWVEESALEPDIFGGVPRAIGKGASLIKADYPDYELLEFATDGEFLPTKFRRSAFGVTNLPYGIRAGIKPTTYRTERSPISRSNLGSLERDGDPNPVQTGTVFTDAAIAGTGERMRVPAYKAGTSNLEYEVLLVSIRGDAAEPPPADILPPVITIDTMIQGGLGVGYSETMTATGGGTINWTATGLPDGLSMSLAGVISGTPTESGTFTVTVTATNESGSTSSDIQIVILKCVPVTGLNEIDGPDVAAPVLAPGQNLRTPITISSSQTAFWTSHSFITGVPQGVMAQRHLLTGALSGGSLIAQAAKTIVDAPWQSHIGNDLAGNTYVTWGGGADLVTANPRLVRGSVYWAKYSDAGQLLVTPKDITDVQFNGTRLHPTMFVFADGVSAVSWFEYDVLRVTIVSAIGVPIPPLFGAEGISLNPAIPPSICGNKEGAFFDIVFSDGFSLGFSRFDRLGNRLPLVSGIERPGESILAVNAVHSPFDASLTVAMSVRIGTDRRVALQRFNINGASVSDRFITGDAELAEFGPLAKNVLVELEDGSFALTYFRNSDNTAILRRFDRMMNPLGTPIVKAGCPGPDYLGLTTVNDQNIIWGFHDLNNLDVFRYEIDCEIQAPVLPPGFLPPAGPTQCRTV